jgi:protein arginine N-methyltransferase 6
MAEEVQGSSAGAGRVATVGGNIVALEEDSSKDIFVITAVPEPPFTAADLTSALQSSAISWRDLDVNEPILKLKIAMLDKMRPLPRVELEVVDLQDEMSDAGETEVSQAGGPSKVDLHYFQSYEDLATHELMLRDRPRMAAYYGAIMQNRDFFRGKTVLDVGCGTGVLSMMAAKAGAKAVFAVEASGIAAHAAALVAHNGLSDTVTVLNARMEDVELPEKVDVIVSEWMGFYLVHESMLNSVLDARDKWLKKGGLMLPSHATIYACPVSMDQYRKDKVDFWEDVCGLDLSPFGHTLAHPQCRGHADGTACTAAEMGASPVVECLSGEQLLAEPAVVASFDCSVVKHEQLAKISRELSFIVTTPGDLAGFAFWFDCRFEVRGPDGTSADSGAAGTGSSRKRSRDDGCGEGGGGGARSGEVVLCTSPKSEDTHWKQTVVMLGVYAPVTAQEQVDVSVTMEQDAANPRIYSISVNT